MCSSDLFSTKYRPCPVRRLSATRRVGIFGARCRDRPRLDGGWFLALIDQLAEQRFETGREAILYGAAELVSFFAAQVALDSRVDAYAVLVECAPRGRDYAVRVVILAALAIALLVTANSVRTSFLTTTR